MHMWVTFKNIKTELWGPGVWENRARSALWPVAVMGRWCLSAPISLVHRRPISMQPLTHLSRMANWTPVYSLQRRNTGWGDERDLQHLGPINPKSLRSWDSSLWPISSPLPLHNPSTSTFLLHLSASLPLLPSHRLPIISMSLRQWA